MVVKQEFVICNLELGIRNLGEDPAISKQTNEKAETNPDNLETSNLFIPNSQFPIPNSQFQITV